MEFEPVSWRLIYSPATNGAWNMAIDEAILEAVGRRHVPPTLRLYSWEPPCLSLGYAQPFSDVDLSALGSFGWDLVRRPTGGRAILHTDELTYSVIGPLDEPRLAGSVLDSYRVLSAALLEALHCLGIPAVSLAEPGKVTQSVFPGMISGNNKGPVCFEVPSNYEITVAGKKLVGSAQARRKDGILQHGSFPLHGDLARITQALAFPDAISRAQAAHRLQERATTAEKILGHPLDWETAAQAFAEAFSNVLNLELHSGSLTPAEQSRAKELVMTKYASASWTERV